MKHALLARLIGIPVAIAVLAAGLVLPAASTALAAPNARLSRSYAAPGDAITAFAYGFTPGDDVVAAADLVVAGHRSRIQSASGTDASGNATIGFKLPGGTSQGTYRVELRDFHGHFAAQNLTVVPLAYVQVGKSAPTAYVIPTHSLYVSGAGFAANDPVHVSATFPLYNGDNTVVSKDATADKDGNLYEAAIRIPRDAQAGKVTLQVTGKSGKKASATLVVTYRPSIVTAAKTVRPGTAVGIAGREFVPESNVRVSIEVSRSGSGNITVSQTVLTDVGGKFNTSLKLPSDVRTGKFTVVAIDSTGGFKAYAPLFVSVNPSIAVTPGTVFPGQSITVSGENFGAGVQVQVVGTFQLRQGGTRNVSGGTTSGGKGNYSVNLTVPNDAAAGSAVIQARSANGQTSTRVQIRERPTPAPTATPAPRATSVPATPTATPIDTSTPTPGKKRSPFRFRYISVWYHTVRAGTYNHIVVQSQLKTQQGIWVTVYFPSGQRAGFYENTDSHGKWEKQFDVPTSAFSATNSTVIVTFQLWHGRANRKSHATFTLVR